MLIFSYFKIVWTLVVLPEHHLRPMCVAKNPSALVSICSPSCFPPNDFFFACVSLHISVLLFPSALSSIPVLPVLSYTSPLIILLSMLAPGPSSSALHSLYPSLPYFTVLWISSWFSSIVSVMRFSSHLFSWNFLGEFVCNWLLFCFFLEFIASSVTLCIFVIVYNDFSRVLYVTSLARRP